MFNWLIIRFQYIYKAMTGNKKEQKKDDNIMKSLEKASQKINI